MGRLVATATVLIFVLVGCSGQSAEQAKPNGVPPATTKPSADLGQLIDDQPPIKDEKTCEPWQIRGDITVTGSVQLTRTFCSSVPAKVKCADWAGSKGGGLLLPGMGTKDLSVIFSPMATPLPYSGPGTPSHPDLLKNTDVMLEKKQYVKGDKGKATLDMKADGGGTLTLTDWQKGADLATVKFVWTCKDW